MDQHQIDIRLTVTDAMGYRKCYVATVDFDQNKCQLSMVVDNSGGDTRTASLMILDPSDNVVGHETNAQLTTDDGSGLKVQVRVKQALWIQPKDDWKQFKFTYEDQEWSIKADTDGEFPNGPPDEGTNARCWPPITKFGSSDSVRIAYFPDGMMYLSRTNRSTGN
jgi:hypothetical protein